MGYHIEASRSGFKELPDRILVREDGYLGAYKFDGEPIVDYWYVPEQRVDELRQENVELRKLCADLYYETKSPSNHATQVEIRMSELGIEVPDA